MKQIQLTRGKTALVDNDDYEIVNQYSWRYNPRGKRREYALSTIRMNGKWVSISMHRLVMGFPEGMVIDHIDGNGLNNKKSNLRICTQSQNIKNQGKRVTNTSGYKGVSKNGSKWEACVYLQKKRLYLGRFTDILEAARVVDAKARELFGEFARLNFPTNK